MSFDYLLHQQSLFNKSGSDVKYFSWLHVISYSIIFLANLYFECQGY